MSELVTEHVCANCNHPAAPGSKDRCGDCIGIEVPTVYTVTLDWEDGEFWAGLDRYWADLTVDQRIQIGLLGFT